MLRGRDVSRYLLDYQNLYLINSHNGYKNVPKIDVENYSEIKKHLEKFEPKLTKRFDKGDTSFNLRNCAYLDAFLKPKIIWKEMSSESPFVIDKEGYFTNDTITFFTGENLEYLLALLNSKLFFYIFSKYYSGGGLGSTGIRFKKEFLSSLPLKQIASEFQQPFIEKADLMLSLNKQLQEVSSKFSKYFSGQFKIEKRSGKLEKWYGLSFNEFIKEINKAIKTQKGTPLTKKEEFDWIDLFEENKAKANKLQGEISRTDKTIDAMVYELYGLSEEEIGIVEGS